MKTVPCKMNESTLLKQVKRAFQARNVVVYLSKRESSEFFQKLFNIFYSEVTKNTAV